ncbi:MAG: hypothetical protein HW405_183 [Candidatus Berkelbacteria bacterium]|nr:hypothetical protein [Candidatus Berkelbacteria bacterium]
MLGFRYNNMKKHKSFTLIEMLVTIMIVVLITSVSVLSLGSAKSAETVSTQGDELKGLIDELKSYAAGNDRDRAGNYVLIIQTSGATGTDYCNQPAAANRNSLIKNEYMICETQDKDISSYTLPGSLDNSNLNRVRAGSLNSDLTIASAGFDPANPTSSVNPIVINIRAYDGQVGYGLKYCDSSSTYCGPTFPTITLTKSDQTQTLTLNSILGTFR